MRKITVNLEDYLANYKADLREGYRIYAEAILIGTVDSHGVIPLDTDSLCALVATARAKKSQAFGVATKRLKAAILLNYLDHISNDFDMTFVLAKKLAHKLIGRAISKPKIIEYLTTSGRSPRDKSADVAPDRIAIIEQTSSYKECEAMLDAALEQLPQLKAEVAAESSIQAISQSVQERLSASAKAGGSDFRI